MTKGETMLTQQHQAATLQQFKAGLRGQLIAPGNPEYDGARRVHNGLIDKRPALIARCCDAADVILAVNFAREQELLLAVRGGGHSAGGLGTCDGGLLLDLAPLRGIRVDPAARTVRVEGGCTWGEVDHATHAFGLATPGGIFSATGVGGLTLGGGIGHLTRRYGLTIDNLLEVDMVLADGSFATANADQNADLFWAVRGGGGNFGVVTSFLFRLHAVHTVYAGPILWPMEQAAGAMRVYRDLLATADAEFNAWFAFLQVPPGAPFPEQLHRKPMCGVVCCYTGPLAAAEAVFRPLRAFGPPALDVARPLSYPALQSMLDALLPAGMQWYWRSDFVNELSDQAIALNVKYGAQIPTALSQMHLYPIDGAVHRHANEDTAFSYRNARWAQVIAGADPDPANRDRLAAWTKDYWLALHPYSAGGGYVNFMMDEGQERVRAAYRDNYARLAHIKAKVDPHNLFRINQNIDPDGDSVV
jgi:FAD/FMN-containing dehydrogenase